MASADAFGETPSGIRCSYSIPCPARKTPIALGSSIVRCSAGILTVAIVHLVSSSTRIQIAARPDSDLSLMESVAPVGSFQGRLAADGFKKEFEDLDVALGVLQGIAPSVQPMPPQ